MLLDAMVGQDQDHNPKVVDLASIHEIPGNMPGEFRKDNSLGAILTICSSKGRKEADRPERSNGCQWQHPAP